MSVSQTQRFARQRPCPVCGGYDQAPRGAGGRCFGFLSDDGAFAHCTRPERAGQLRLNTNSGTYAHRLAGDCGCGERHDPRPAPKDPTDKRSEPVRTTVYPIRDAAGQVVAEHVRSEYADGGKSFIWRRNGKKGLSGLSVANLPLYGLPELLATPPGSAVVVVEGEKARDALAGRGVVAVGTVTGAMTIPNDATLRPLLDYEVLLWPDNDDDGQHHMDRIASRLMTLGTAPMVVTWPNAPPKGDAADFVGDDAALTQLLASATPYATPPPGVNGQPTVIADEVPLLHLTELGNLLAEPTEQVSWVWNLTLPTGGVSVCVAKPKVGKSTLARNLLLKVASGEPFLGRSTAQGAVVYLALEDKRSEVKRHFQEMGATGNEPIKIHVGVAPEEALPALEQAIQESGAVLAVVDPLFRFLRARDVNDYAVVNALFEPLMALARNTGCHIMAVHHAGKSEREGGDGILGSTAIFGAVDTALILRRRGDGSRSLESVQRYGEDIPKTVLSFDDGTRTLEAGGTVEALELAKAKEDILTLLADGVRTEAEIRDGVEGKTRTLSPALRQLHQDGLVSREGAGRRGDPYRYARILVPTKAAPGDSSSPTADTEISRLLVPSIYREQAEQEKQETHNGDEGAF